MKSKEAIIKTIVTISLAVLIAVAAFVMLKGWNGGHFNSITALRSYIASYGIWAPLILALIQMLQVILPVLPGFMGCIAGAALFGTAGGFCVNYIGISIGSILAYWLASHYGTQLVNKMIPIKKYERYIERINQNKSYTIVLFFSILLPLAPDDFLCYFSGLIKMSSRKFITIIIAAKPWCILFYSIFFSHFL